MRIGIIALNFQPGAMGGVETYFRTLLAQLQRLDMGDEYVVVLPEGRSAELRLDHPKFSVLELPLRRDLISRAIRLMTFTPAGRGRTRLARRIDALNCDLLHFPLQVMLPFDVRTPAIVSCMDIQHEHLPAFFSAAQRLLRRIMHRQSLLRAKHIIAISHFVTQTLQEAYGISVGRVTTVYPCVDEALFASEHAPWPGRAEPLQRYFLYPAAWWPHKNHERLLCAFSQVVRQYPDTSLVLSGISARQQPPAEELISKLGLHGRVQLTGFLRYEELASLYRYAWALVFPSLYEGFGIPVIEAMHAGCPVICSNATSLPEVAADAALYCDPLDSKDIARAMLALLEDPRRRAELITAGRQNARRFSGRRLAVETREVYERQA
jgi:glycosyltransferase involved in cell wall biosynthesis